MHQLNQILTPLSTPDPFENDGFEDGLLGAAFGSQSSPSSTDAPSDLEVYLEEPVEGTSC